MMTKAEVDKLMSVAAKLQEDSAALSQRARDAYEVASEAKKKFDSQTVG